MTNFVQLRVGEPITLDRRYDGGTLVPYDPLRHAAVTAMDGAQVYTSPSVAAELGSKRIAQFDQHELARLQTWFADHGYRPHDDGQVDNAC